MVWGWRLPVIHFLFHGFLLLLFLLKFLLRLALHFLDLFLDLLLLAAQFFRLSLQFRLEASDFTLHLRLDDG